LRVGDEQQQLSHLQQQRKSMVQEMDRQKSKIEQLENSGAQYMNTKQAVMDDGNALTNDDQTLTKQLESRQQDLLSLEQQRENTYQREVQLNEQLQATLNELMEAKAIQKESEKGSKLKESLATLQQVLPGIHGQLSKLCKPTQRKYGLAVNTILGRNLEAIVVDDQHTAIQCIQYLREQRVGTATFLPLNSLVVPTINDRLRNLPRSSLAVDVIHCDHIYLAVVQYACGNSVVCESLTRARHICY
jgi:structural maintenance of chromosome 1